MKIKKGHSCSSMDYHHFLETIAENITLSPLQRETGASSSLSVQHSVTMVVESSASCRRPKVTRDGHIMVGTKMSADDIRYAVETYSNVAKEQVVKAKQQSQQRKEAQRQLQGELGLQGVRQVGVVDHDSYLDALSRLLDQRMTLKPLFAGHSLGISSRGSFCHISDSGQLVIPTNWKYD